MESRKSLLSKLALFNLGLTAMGTQIVMIREFLAVFQGNELIIGMFLGCWMVLTAAGAFLAVQSSKFRVQNWSFFILGALPLLMLPALIWLHSAFVPYGTITGIGRIFLIVMLVLAPFCLVSGMLFPTLVESLSAEKEKNLLHQGYALDSAGSILGGLLFSLVFIFLLSSFESLLLLTFTCFLLGIAWRRGSGEDWKIGGLGDWGIGRLGDLRIWRFGDLGIWGIGICFLIISILICSFIFKPDELLSRMAFKNQQLLEVKTSPFGKLAVTKTGDQLNIYENTVPLPTGDDPAAREEPVHYAMLMHPDPQNVLLISGGTGGTIDELLKYPATYIDYLEINPWLIALIEKYKPFPESGRVNYIFGDARKNLNQSSKKYDVIILNTPEPLSAELNRFYTVEFFQLLKGRLNSGGIICVPLSAAGNYMNETSRMMHSVLYNSLQAVFHQIRIIPGDKDFFLASQDSLDGSFLKKYQSAGFTNIYVNPSYVNEDLQKMRSDLIIKDLLPGAPVNSDLKPAIFSLSLTHWLERFRIDPAVFPVVLSILIVVAFLFLRPLNLGLFTSGFTASSLEFMLLIWFQVTYGYIFQMTGVIFAVFMAGLAVGAVAIHRLRAATFTIFLSFQAGIAIFSGLLALLMFSIPTISGQRIIIPLILLLILVTGLLTGAQFALSGSLRHTSVRQSSGEAFSADLLGSAIGIVLASVYLVPQLGLPVTGMALAGLNLLSLGVMAWKCRQSSVVSR